MKSVDKNTLLDSLAQHGFELMRPMSSLGPEEMLHALLAQNEVRLLEGFPVVFAHVLQEKAVLDWESSKWQPDRELSEKARHRLMVLLVLTHELFEMFALDKKLDDRAVRLLSKLDPSSELLKKYVRKFGTQSVFKVDEDLELSRDRLMNNFRNYVTFRPEEKVLEKVQEMKLELLLSQLFTARQKELVRKRLENKTLTKTEKEYFYRVVKKRLQALANEELHHLAKGLV